MKDKAFFFFSYDEQRRNFPVFPPSRSLDFLNRADICMLTAPIPATNVANVTTAAPAAGQTFCPAFGVTAATATNLRLGTGGVVTSLAQGKGLTTTQVSGRAELPEQHFW